MGVGKSRHFQVSPRQSVCSAGAHLALAAPARRKVSKAEKAAAVAEHPSALKRLFLANSGVSLSDACREELNILVLHIFPWKS